LQVRSDLRRCEKRPDAAQGACHGSAASPPGAHDDCRSRLGGCPLENLPLKQAGVWLPCQSQLHASVVRCPSGGFKSGNIGRGPNHNLACESRRAMVFSDSAAPTKTPRAPGKTPGVPTPSLGGLAKRLGGPGSRHETILSGAKRDFRQPNAPQKTMGGREDLNNIGSLDPVPAFGNMFFPRINALVSAAPFWYF